MTTIPGAGGRPLPWRVGQHIPRHIYDAEDGLIGTVDTPSLARTIVAAINTRYPPADWHTWSRDTTTRLNHLREGQHKIMTNQEHLDRDIAAIGASFTQAIADLKQQIADGAAAQDLDFTAADALVAAAAQADTDAGPFPPTEPPATP